MKPGQQLVNRGQGSKHEALVLFGVAVNCIRETSELKESAALVERSSGATVVWHRARTATERKDHCIVLCTRVGVLLSCFLVADLFAELYRCFWKSEV